MDSIKMSADDAFAFLVQNLHDNQENLRQDGICPSQRRCFNSSGAKLARIKIRAVFDMSQPS